jgi:hypothetical protein
MVSRRSTQTHHAIQTQSIVFFTSFTPPVGTGVGFGRLGRNGHTFLCHRNSMPTLLDVLKDCNNNTRT